MLKDLVDLYRQCWRYALACPFPLLVPIAAEAAQHLVEYHQGFYSNIVQARLVHHSVMRMGFGTVKVVSLLFAGYWVMRWLKWRDPARSAGFDRRSLATFLPLLLFELLLELPGIWLPALSAHFATLPIWMILPSLAIGLLLADWHRTAPLGEAGGPITSIKISAPVFFWALGFELVAVLPAMMAHYALGIGALKTGGGVQLTLLAADTMFVGYLGAIVTGTSWYISEHARSRSARAAADRHRSS